MTYIVSGGALNSTHSWTLGSRHSSHNCCRTTALLSALTSFNLCSLQLHFSAFSPIMFVAVLQTVGDCSHTQKFETLRDQTHGAEMSWVRSVRTSCKHVWKQIRPV